MYPFFVILKATKPEKFEPEYAVPEDKPSKCAADQKTHYTGVYADIRVEESDHPLPRVPDDETVTFSQPLFEKMNPPPNNNLSDPTRQDETKFNEQDFKEEDVGVLTNEPCMDSNEEELPPVPPQRKGKLYAVMETVTSSSENSIKDCCTFIRCS